MRFNIEIEILPVPKIINSSCGQPEIQKPIRGEYYRGYHHYYHLCDKPGVYQYDRTTIITSVDASEDKK